LSTSWREIARRDESTTREKTMSDSHVPTRTPTGVHDTPAPAASQAQDSAGPGLQDRAKDTASQAAQSFGDVAHDARDRAAGVADTATKQVRSLADQARTELDTQAQSQQKRAAEGLRSLSNELSSMARNSEDPGYATDLVKQVSQTTDRAAAWLDDRDPGTIVRDVQDFARRRPGLFIALAAGAGILVGRLARGMKDAPSDDQQTSSGQGHQSPAAPAATAGSFSEGVTGAHSGGWAADERLGTAEPVGLAPTTATPPTTVTPEPIAKHGENDVERF